MVDLGIVVSCWLVLLGLTQRPVFSGIAAGGAAVAAVVASRLKRVTLGESLVFSDLSLAWQLIAFPRFYLPFVPIGIAAAALGLPTVILVVLALIEPPRWNVLAGLSLVIGGGVAVVALVHLATRLQFARQADDACRFGLFATLVGHAQLARRERKAHRASLVSPRSLRLADDRSPHLILVQVESFCDPGRILKGFDAARLPALTRLRADGAVGGPLRVSAFGANTVRTEFGVLTGLKPKHLGLDWFNPYAAFARQPIPSLASRLKAGGWSTTCIHPFDGRFYNRNKVMPKLGFDTFEDKSTAFPGWTDGLIPDSALTERVGRKLKLADGPAFIFLVTVYNHGPYVPRSEALGWPAPTGVPSAEQLVGWLSGTEEADKLVGRLADIMKAQHRPGILVVYGDHPPPLAAAFAAIGAPLDLSDWLIWRTDGAAATGQGTIEPALLHKIIATSFS